MSQIKLFFKAIFAFGTNSNYKSLDIMLNFTILNAGFLAPFLDKAFILPEKYQLYLIIQITTAVLALFVKYGIRTQINFDFLASFTMIFSLSYAVICQFFIPCSFISFLLNLFAVGLFLDFPLKKFNYISIIFGILMVTAITISPVGYSHIPQDLEKFKADAIQTVLMFNIFILVAHYLKYEERRRREFVQNTLTNFGNQSAMLIHELKNKLSPVNNYITYLKQNSQEHTEIVQDLNHDFKELLDYTTGINQIFAFKEKITQIDCPKLVAEIVRLYETKLRNIKVEANQTGQLTLDENAFKTILVNLLLNSSDALQGREDRKITISLNGPNFRFQDNGPGFSKTMLARINSGEFYSEKATGSGVGLYIIKNYVQNLKGKLSVYNKQGAVIEIKFTG